MNGYKRSILVIACIFFGLAIILGAVIVNAQTWHPTNQATVAWDAVTTLNNGNPIPPEDIITYDVSIRAYPDGEITIPYQNVSGLEQVLTFPDEGRYLVGITAIREIAGEDDMDPLRSDTCWSDGSEPGCLGPDGEFGIQFYLPLAVPTGLRIQ